MRSIQVIFLFSILTLQLEGQNLVPNYSFEQYDTCPNNLSQIRYAIPWFQPTLGTSDYFNQCNTGSPSISPDVPLNFAGYQVPVFGVAYAGFIAYNSREYVEVKLISPMLANKRYCVSFFVSLADSSIYGVDAIGAFLSTDTIQSNNSSNMPYTPQVSNPISNIILDTANWVLISGNLIASGGEQYITIGNFNTNALTDTVKAGGNGISAYYYLDNVSVYLCDSTSDLTNVPNVFSPNNDGVNDVFEINSTNLTDFKLSIYNRWGTKVYDFISPNDAWDGYTTTGESCSEGVYFYYLTAIGVDGKEYSQKGCLQLLR